MSAQREILRTPLPEGLTIQRINLLLTEKFKAKMKQLAAILSIVAVFWNVENFYDYREERQSKARFYAKCSGIGKEVLRIADHYGRIPDLIGFAELENSFVLSQLRYSSLLRKLDYAQVHYESPDHRGIDCGLLYRKSSLQLIDSKPCHLYDSTGRIMATRDILLASFKMKDGRRLDVLVNHHPSKYGGKSDYGRNVALRRMLQIRDSLLATGGEFLSFGDFNDTPGWTAPGLKDLSLPLERKGEGTIRFNGSWELIDRCFTADSADARMEIFDDPALSVKDAAHGGTKPRRTNSGPRYIGGISDHYPIVVLME